jgi:hypothetical protein
MEINTMKKFLLFISIFLLPFLAHSQVARGTQRTIPDIHPNSRINHPRRSDNHHHMKNRTFGKKGDRNKDKRRHRHNARAHAHNGRMG